MVRWRIMTLFKRDNEIAIGTQIPLTSNFYFCIYKTAVVKSWIQLHGEGWRVINPTLPETTNA
jgi:hypothetical protein